MLSVKCWNRLTRALVTGRARTGFGRFWKVMEFDNAVFQDPESFGKREVFQNGYGEGLDFA